MKLARALVVSAIASIAALGVTAPANATLHRVPTSAPTAADAGGAVFEDQVMVAINAARVTAGLKPVRFFDTCVDRMATDWGNRIASTDVFAHRDPSDVLRKCHQTWAGETLIRGEGLTPQSVVDAWLASPPHRAVLLKARASRAGLSVTIDPQGRQVGVLNFSDARR